MQPKISWEIDVFFVVSLLIQNQYHLIFFFLSIQLKFTWTYTWHFAQQSSTSSFTPVVTCFILVAHYWLIGNGLCGASMFLDVFPPQCTGESLCLLVKLSHKKNKQTHTTIVYCSISENNSFCSYPQCRLLGFGSGTRQKKTSKEQRGFHKVCSHLTLSYTH